MQKFTQMANPQKTKQTEPIPGEVQVKNHAGGYVYEIPPLKALERFLILGTEGGTYYVNERRQTKELSDRLMKLIRTDGPLVIQKVVDVSAGRRAYKNDAALYVLALCCSLPKDAAGVALRGMALEALPRVARTGMHLQHFWQYAKDLAAANGRQFKRKMAYWYENKDLKGAAYQILKYQGRDGVKHRDIIRMAHPEPLDESWSALYKWALTEGDEREAAALAVGEAGQQLVAFHRIHKPDVSRKEAAQLIQDHRLTREMVPTELLKFPDIWAALANDMPYTAMIRNLANMTRAGLLVPMGGEAMSIAEKIADEANIKKARPHPMQLLVAYATYLQGIGTRGVRWSPVPEIGEALMAAFKSSFNYLESTGLRYMVAVDVSPSMNHGSICGARNLTPRAGAAAMALAIVHQESRYWITAFAGNFVDLPITKNSDLSTAISMCQRANWERTDCSVPMRVATARKLDVDVFVVITDNETWSGSLHPSQALREYRQKLGKPNAKLVVVAMTSSNFSIADPNDPNMFDVCGFDADTPAMINEMARM